MDRHIHGKPRQQDHRYGMSRQAFLDPLGCLVMGYGCGRKTVVTEDAQVFCEDIGLCAVRLLVIPCLAYQEAIQILLAAVEAVEHVLAAQLLERAEFTHSRTLGVLRSSSRRGRDFDGASSAATKASYCLALSENSR